MPGLLEIAFMTGIVLITLCVVVYTVGHSLLRTSSGNPSAGNAASSGNAEEQPGRGVPARGEGEAAIRRAVREEVRRAVREEVRPLHEKIEQMEQQRQRGGGPGKQPRRDWPEDPHDFGLIAEAQEGKAGEKRAA